MNNLQKDLIDECRQEINEVIRELKVELGLIGAFGDDQRITMETIFNMKRVWKWGVNIIALGLAITAVIVSGPIGWAAGVAVVVVETAGWLISKLFEDREVKARKAREKLSQWLYANIDKTRDTLRTELEQWFQDLLKKQVQVLLVDLGAVASQLHELANILCTLAWKLNDQQKALSRKLVKEALSQTKSIGVKLPIRDIARVPGFATMILIKDKDTSMRGASAKLRGLLGEHIWFVIDNGNKSSILTQAIGKECTKKSVNIEDDIGVAHVAIDGFSPAARSRISLAQQLTGLYVMR
jgi:hypothetical protein